MKPIDQARNALAFLEDETHQHAFDKLIWGLRQRRDAAAREVPEWEELRTLASQIKEHTLSNLAYYLELFEAHATGNGVRVHWARDAHEHNQIVYDILSSHGAGHLVKSKSMLTEECDTRPFLERRGIEVTETDLGERIQQLDDQPPSHIVGPAFQKTTQEVAELFHRVYGSDPDRADPVYLAGVMREHTRPLILHAEAGMTGANFAVAQTGAVVTVTNEGNADLSGNVPKLRICSVGIEKMVHGVDEFAVFIRLLTRSATGERITQYTSHFAGPRAGGEMHIVLVDNGRTQRLADERFWPSLKCIRCGACMNTCPVYRRSGGLSYETPGIPSPNVSADKPLSVLWSWTRPCQGRRRAMDRQPHSRITCGSRNVLHSACPCRTAQAHSSRQRSAASEPCVARKASEPSEDAVCSP